jgi:hypothetical protein
VAINPDGIPQFSGNPDVVETAGGDLVAAGGSVRTTGTDTHNAWQGLAAFYSAPEADQLFAATKPVQTTAAEFADDIEEVGRALKDYAVEVRPLARKLATLKTDAQSFVAGIKGLGDDAWKKQVNVDRNNQLVHDVDNTIVAIQAAERRCANRIGSTYGRVAYVVDDGSGRPNSYGVNAVPDNADRPWGKPEEKRRDGFWDHVGGGFSGFFADSGLWGDLTGLYHMAAFWTPEFKDTWNGLTFLSGGWSVDVGAWGEAWKNVGKSLVGWDDWAKGDWSHAAGTTAYNVVTFLAAPAKVATVARSGKLGGTAAKMASIAAKLDVGQLGRLTIDSLPDLADLVKSVKGITDGINAQFGELSARLTMPQLAFDLPGVGPIHASDFGHHVDHTPNPHVADLGRMDMATNGHPPDAGHLDNITNPHVSDAGQPDATPDGRPGLDQPHNDPDKAKHDPETIAEVDKARKLIADDLQQIADDAWDHIDNDIDDILQRDGYTRMYDDMLADRVRKFEAAEGHPPPPEQLTAMQHAVKSVVTSLVSGTEAHRYLEDQITSLMSDPPKDSVWEQLTADGQYRMRAEVGFNADGLETRGNDQEVRPDLIMERQARDPATGELKWEVVHVYDLKTGVKTGIEPSWARKVTALLDPLYSPEELRPTQRPRQ